MKDNTKYDLTEEEYQICLKKAEMQVFLNARKSKHPTSIFIVAQPGAGKTGLRTYIERESGKLKSFIEFDPDEVAIHHKHYHKILEEFPKESYSILQRFVSPALDTYLKKKAVQLRANMIQEGTFAATNAYIDILDFQKNGGNANIGPMNENGEREEVKVQGGYEIDVNVLAVHRFESLLSSYEREQYDFIEHNLPPRAVTAPNHDRAYNNMINTIRNIEGRKLSDNIRVFKRGKEEEQPEVIYETGSKKYPSAVEAILQEREKNRVQILSNPEVYRQRIAKLKQRVSQNKNVANAQIQIVKIEELEQEFEQDLEQYVAQEEPTN